MTRPVICIEGLDGVGKSETAAGLAARIGALLVHTPPVELAAVRDVWRLPCRGTINGRYLYFLAALTITSERIREHRQRTPIVLDRYLLSTYCYHAALGANVVVDLTTLGLEKPTQVVVLDCEEEVRRHRLLGRGKHTHEDVLTLGETGQKVRAFYARWPTLRIDTTNLTINEVIDRICTMCCADSVDHRQDRE